MLLVYFVADCCGGWGLVTFGCLWLVLVGCFVLRLFVGWVDCCLGLFGFLGWGSGCLCLLGLRFRMLWVYFEWVWLIVYLFVLFVFFWWFVDCLCCWLVVVFRLLFRFGFGYYIVLCICGGLGCCGWVWFTDLGVVRLLVVI